VRVIRRLAINLLAAVLALAIYVALALKDRR
jgi:hypothetical protein